MLRKEHLLCRITSGRVRPQLCDPESEALTESASGLLAVYQGALESAVSRNELEELTALFASGRDHVKLIAGWSKLLADRCTFTVPAELDFCDMRRKCFAASAELLRSGKIPGPFTGEVDLYGDLPGLERLTSMKTVSVRELIELGNLAQCQALLLYASEIKLILNDPDSSTLRRVMKAVKFFRLLASFSKKGRREIRMMISGPASLFGPSGRYALSLASLLPVIVGVKEWKLEAELDFRERKVKLKLDSTMGLRSRVRSFSSFVPEEVRMFHRLFAEKAGDWQIVGDTPFIDGGENRIVFPDLSFRSADGRFLVHLELFHRWHSGQLEQRIGLLKKRPELPLIIGIDRAVAGQEQLQKLCSGMPELEKRCFLFRDFPGVENCLRTLKRFCSGADLH